MAFKRVSLFLCCLLVFCLVCPVFGADVIQGESDNFGFSYDDSNIYFVTNRLPGNMLGVDTQLLPVSKVYFYIPVSKPVVSLDFNFSLFKTTGGVTYDSCDWGTIASNSYNYREALSKPAVMWLGSNTIPGSSARTISYKVSFTDLPFSSSNSYRFIRLVFDIAGGDNSLILWLNKSLDQNLSGVLGNPTYTLSSDSSTAYGSVYAGQFESSGYYITGSTKYKYYNGSSVVTDTLSLNNGTGGTAGYLYVPSHYIAPRVGHNPQFQIKPFSTSGTLTPSSSSQVTDLQGTYVSRTYVDTVTMSATRSYSDQELIQAVDDASALNHHDLQGISDQMQEIVDHMNGLEEQGQQINGATSQQTINDTAQVVNTGTSSFSSMGNQISSGMQSVTDSAGSYIDFVGYGFTALLGFGPLLTPPLYLAFVAMIFISVGVFVVRKLL